MPLNIFLGWFQTKFPIIFLWNPYDVILEHFIWISLQSHNLVLVLACFYSVVLLNFITLLLQKTEQLGAGPPWLIEWHQSRLVLLNGTRDTYLSSWEWGRFTFKYHNNILSHFYHACVLFPWGDVVNFVLYELTVSLICMLINGT